MKIKKFFLKGLVVQIAIITCSLFLMSETVEPIPIPKVNSAPEIDGKLDETIWKTAFKMTDFKTFKPDFGKDPQEKTEAFMLYDSENFYFGVRCYAKEPNRIKASVTKRDNMFEDDFVGIIIDTFNDKQKGYGFLINPLGIQGDGMMDINGNLEPSQDMVWYSKGQIDELGYSVECRIPIKSIRFPNKKEITMRIGFFRQLVRHSEMISSPPVYPDKGGILTQCQPISVKGLKYKRVIEILPALTTINRKVIDEGKLSPDEKQTDLSLTAKVGLTSDLVLDATINPDFSQVEADAGQVDVNLRYDLFFPEKRSFFLEGKENFKIAGNTEGAPLWGVVHTRNIINPQFGIKLAGKIGSRNSVAAIFSRDEVGYENEIIRPYFSIFRLRHALKNDDSYIGGFYTGKDQQNEYNRIVGSDGRLRLSQTSVAEYHFFGSITQPPESDKSHNGHALGLRYNYGTRKVLLDFGFQDISKDFQIDTGFITRTGISRLAIFSMYQIYPESKFFKKIEPFYWSFHIYDKHSRMFETFNLFALRFQLPRSSQFRIDAILGNEIFENQKFDRSGVGLQSYSQLAKQIFLHIFFRHTKSIFYDPDNPYQGNGNRLSLGIRYQPFDKLNSYLSIAYSDFYRESDGEKIYDYTLVYNRTTFQLNKYLFFRGIVEYNTYWKKLTTDFLASFTYIPGTVVHLGYGSVFRKLRWEDSEYVESNNFIETKQGFFFKVSYLLRW